MRTYYGVFVVIVISKYWHLSSEFVCMRVIIITIITVKQTKNKRDNHRKRKQTLIVSWKDQRKTSRDNG